MSIFSTAELEFLRGQRLARLATIGPDGAPQVRPVGFAVDPETGSIDIPGLDNPSTQKWRNVVADGRVALVVDDVVVEPWTPRALEIRGVAEALADVVPAGMPWAAPGVIRIRPQRILVFGIEQGAPESRRIPVASGS